MENSVQNRSPLEGRSPSPTGEHSLLQLGR